MDVTLMLFCLWRGAACGAVPAVTSVSARRQAGVAARSLTSRMCHTSAAACLQRSRTGQVQLVVTLPLAASCLTTVWYIR